jgi:hypothetical protein
VPPVHKPFTLVQSHSKGNPPKLFCSLMFLNVRLKSRYLLTELLTLSPSIAGGDLHLSC